MLSPTESPPASAAPRLAASIKPGPPPVITAKPCLARQAEVSRRVEATVDLLADPVEPPLVQRLGVVGDSEQVLVVLRPCAANPQIAVVVSHVRHLPRFVALISSFWRLGVHMLNR